MNAIISTGGAPLTMTSREIADLLEKQHGNIKISAERLSEKGVIGTLAAQEFIHKGNIYTEYLLNKRDSLILVAQNCPEFTARIVDRWQELEDMVAQPRIPKSLPEALRLAADESERADRAEVALAESAPKAAGFDRIAASDGSLCLTDAAKTLQLPPRFFIWMLSTSGWIYRRPSGANWLAYQDKINSGHLEHRAILIERPMFVSQSNTQVRVTAKGLTRLARMLEESAAPTLLAIQ